MWRYNAITPDFSIPSQGVEMTVKGTRMQGVSAKEMQLSQSGTLVLQISGEVSQ